MKIPKARQLPSGSWFIQLRINGKSISFTADTEEEAVARALAYKAGILDAKKKAKSITLTQAIDHYIAERQSSDSISPSTVRGYRMIQKHRFQAMMQRDITRITKEQWQRAANAEAKQCSPKTLKNAWGFLSSVIAQETGQRLAISLPKVAGNEHPYLAPEQIPTFLKAVRGTSVEIPALLALCSLRRSELLNLTWDMVDMPKGIIYVSGAAVMDENEKLVHKKHNKNVASKRAVPMIPQLQQALETAPKKGEYVVTMSPSGMFQRINIICEESGLPKVGVHGLRHSYASLAYHLQIPAKIAAEIGGWSDDQTMMKIYTHISQRDITDRAKALVDFYKNINANENANENKKFLDTQHF